MTEPEQTTPTDAVYDAGDTVTVTGGRRVTRFLSRLRDRVTGAGDDAGDAVTEDVTDARDGAGDGVTVTSVTRDSERSHAARHDVTASAVTGHGDVTVTAPAALVTVAAGARDRDSAGASRRPADRPRPRAERLPLRPPARRVDPTRPDIQEADQAYERVVAEATGYLKEAAPKDADEATGEPEAAPAGPSGTEKRGPRVIMFVYYIVMVVIALVGQAQGMVSLLSLAHFHTPWGWVTVAPLLAAVIGGVVGGALELFAATLLLFADWRIAYAGETAVAARVLAVLASVGVAAFNWVGHDGNGEGGQRAVFVGASVSAFILAMLHTAARRRDRERRTGKRRQTRPHYGVWQWLRHPGLTSTAARLAEVDPALGWSGSLDAARRMAEDAKRTAALEQAIRRFIADRVTDPLVASLWMHRIDMDQLAANLRESADLAPWQDRIETMLMLPEIGGPEPAEEPAPPQRPAGEPKTGDVKQPSKPKPAKVRTAKPAKKPTAEALLGNVRRIGEPSAQVKTWADQVESEHGKGAVPGYDEIKALTKCSHGSAANVAAELRRRAEKTA